MKGRTESTFLQLAPQACYRLGTDAQRDALMEGVQGAIGAPSRSRTSGRFFLQQRTVPRGLH